MVIDDFNVVSVAIFKAETHAPLVVNADAPLSGTVMSQRFKLVGRGKAQIFNALNAIQLQIQV